MKSKLILSSVFLGLSFANGLHQDRKRTSKKASHLTRPKVKQTLRQDGMVIPTVPPEVMPTPEEIPIIPPEVIPPETMPTLPPEEVPTVPPEEVPTVPPEEVPTVPPGTMPTVPPGTIPTVPPGMCPTVPPGTIPTVPPGTIPTVPPGMMPNIPPGMIPIVPDETSKYFINPQGKRIGKKLPLDYVPKKGWWKGWNKIPKSFWVNLDFTPGNEFIVLNSQLGSIATDVIGNVITSNKNDISNLFIVEFVGENIVHLRSYYGGYLSIGNDGKVNASSRKSSSDTQFFVLQTNKLCKADDANYIFLRASNGKFLNINNGIISGENISSEKALFKGLFWKETDSKCPVESGSEKLPTEEQQEDIIKALLSTTLKKVVKKLGTTTKPKPKPKSVKKKPRMPRGTPSSIPPQQNRGKVRRYTVSTRKTREL